MGKFGTKPCGKSGGRKDVADQELLGDTKPSQLSRQSLSWAIASIFLLLLPFSWMNQTLDKIIKKQKQSKAGARGS